MRCHAPASSPRRCPSTSTTRRRRRWCARSSRSSSARPTWAGSSPSGWCASAVGRRREEIPHETLALVEALEAQGDHDALLRFLPTARAASGYLAVLTPTCDRAEGLARAAAGDTATAQTLLARAVTGFDRMSLPLQAARSREAMARVRPDRADRLLRAALQSYATLGARRDAARAESALAGG